MRLLRIVGISLTVVALLGFASAQSWTPVTSPGVNIGAMLQLRDGRILVHEEQSGNSTAWHILTPSATGSYTAGTWSSGGTMPSYSPWYFGSQVLLTGRTVAVEGGEYNFGAFAWTTLGALGTITPFGGITWASNAAPSGWTSIGDAESVVLDNGKYMQANCCTSQNAIFNGPNSWVATGSVIQSSNDESGFTALTTGKVLTVDAKNSSCGTGTQGGAELYTITNNTTGVGSWACTGQTPIHLYNPSDEELGSAVLMYNNKVFQMGGNVVASAVYDVASGTWTAGPTPPRGLDQADGPGALEPNGKVLEMLSPGLFQGGCQFMEYDPTAGTLTNAPNPANCPSDSSFVGHLMILPTGQIMFTDFSGTVEVYNPAGSTVSGVAAKILIPSTNLNRNSTNNLLYGYQLNGLTENNGYGDDYQGATNYPLVRLTNISTGNVYYAFTHDDSTHSIAPNTFGSTMFDIPNIPAGQYHLVSVANGIASNQVTVTVH